MQYGSNSYGASSSEGEELISSLTPLTRDNDAKAEQQPVSAEADERNSQTADAYGGADSVTVEQVDGTD